MLKHSDSTNNKTIVKRTDFIQNKTNIVKHGEFASKTTMKHIQKQKQSHGYTGVLELMGPYIPFGKLLLLFLF